MSEMRALVERVSSDMEAQHQQEVARHETVQGWREQVQWLHERLVQGLLPMMTAEIGGEPLCVIETRASIPKDLRLNGGEVKWEPIDIFVKLGGRTISLHQHLDPTSDVINYQRPGSGEWFTTDKEHIWVICQANAKRLPITDDTLGAFFVRAYEHASKA